ncbi:hypothetical protein GL267_005460 [Acidithiobacillus ferrianus]|uniref:Uncharacterized protein n=1 Tax=Acidithiobacillus ferrianus TaxID=2678518 RepID=A0ACD5HA35_9PROT|nr:hypothetical protein [Acidithiobacillus ferrianus]
MQPHELKQVIEAADQAISCGDFDSLMDFYAEDATLVVRPGLNVSGKQHIRQAFSAIAEYFNHSLVVKQGDSKLLKLMIRHWLSHKLSSVQNRNLVRTLTLQWQGAQPTYLSEILETSGAASSITHMEPI